MSPSYKSLPLLLLLPSRGEENQFADVIDDHWIKDRQVYAEYTTPLAFKTVA